MLSSKDEVERFRQMRKNQRMDGLSWHKETFDLVRDLIKNQVPVSESIIKQIHYLVLADKWEYRGVYRRVPVRIMGEKHEPVQPYLIQPEMERLLESYRNSTEHIVPRRTLFQIEFEGIHPFIDEND